MMEICEHAVTVHGDKVVVSLEGFQKRDPYGTNLELTGLGNWFGSMNMCNMMADNSSMLFGSEHQHQQRAHVEPDSAGCTAPSANNKFCMLELGSGLGRAGLMAMKLMEREGDLISKQCTGDKVLPSWRCVLTDGEDEIVTLLENNFTRNIAQSNSNNNSCTSNNSNNSNVEDAVSTTICENATAAKNSDAAVQARVTAGSSCQQLWWGPNAELLDLQQRYPDGFDLIIGADLIYGRDAVVPDAPETVSENNLDSAAVVESGGETGTDTDTVTAGAGAVAELDSTAVSSATPAAAVVGGFCRDKLHLLLYTVCALLSKRGSAAANTYTTSDTVTATVTTTNYSDTVTSSEVSRSKFDVQRKPAFYLAITRRELLPMEELSALALSMGLVVGMLDDYTFDIFDTNVDSDSMFWRDTILSFTRV